MLAGAKDAPAESESVRVPRAQLMLVDELARHEASIQVDEAYRRLRRELENFSELTPADAPHGFRGTLRDYQREGLAWLKLLGRLGFGACLADDMGLGKTVQVLALLLGRNRRRRRLPPSLVVAPSSVVFNWIDEARRFTPSLRVVAYAGAERPTLEAALDKADLIVTSYTMLRNEASSFGAVVFDYVVLDEAQAIKNYDTATAKAARALSASCRLTMTGTPIENHLGELGSQLEFLNPGMLSSSPRLYKALTAGRVGDESLQIVQRAVRPFLLRRTKGEVARELPDRIEKTLYVELEGAERRRYDELLTHYRERIKQKVAKLGLARSTPQVLEALLRLRQAACHPGLLDAGRAAESSAKLDRLLFELDRVLAAGGKCLVFSQFTSLLAIVKKCLDARGIAYEYLDGATRDRKNPVQRFQNSTDVGIFLISLKAGGVGLNLTAAEHVFLLDPWWNPAVEAQAIDRTHRIGQSRHILAYKLIARRTVEEKVVELQREKRALAQAILGEDAGLGAKLTREDLEALLD
jgi:SNF2 family DNA or RNA helicase